MMALRIDVSDSGGAVALVADRRVWANADWSALVEDGADGCAYLVAGAAGGEVDAVIVQRMGLAVADDGRLHITTHEPAAEPCEAVAEPVVEPEEEAGPDMQDPVDVAEKGADEPPATKEAPKAANKTRKPVKRKVKKA